MKRVPAKTEAVIVLAAMLVMGLVMGCGGGGGDEEATNPTHIETGQEGTVPGEPVTILIGNLTDLTGPAASGMETVNQSLHDVVHYYNDNGLIPGVELKIITYDTKYDAARNIPGYEWLISQGADLVWTAVPGAPDDLADRAEAAGVCLFTVASSQDTLTPPGHVFNVAIVPQYDAYTLLSWIAENHWDWQTKGPARLGGASWNDAYSPHVFEAAQAYCEAHPDQFQWVGGYLTGYKFTWTAEAEDLKDTDYVFVPGIMTNFVKPYREAGGEGTFLMGEPNLAFLGQLGDAGLWNEADGALVIRNTLWWNETGWLIDWTRQLLTIYHPEHADAIRDIGVGYLGAGSVYQMVEAIKAAVEAVGPESFTSETLYQAAQSLSLKIDGLERFSFSPTKRCTTNYYVVYQLDAASQDLVRISDNWYPAQHGP